MYYFYGKINRGHIVCPLYGSSLYLRESAIRGSTVVSTYRGVSVVINLQPGYPHHLYAVIRMEYMHPRKSIFGQLQ